MDKLISTFQNVFIQGRSISNNNLLTHEIFDTLKRKKGFGALKIDMCKAYDRVNWTFLKAVMLAMNFSTTWVEWVIECVTTVKYVLLVNGSPSQTFQPTRGIRQVDPISPLPFFAMCQHSLNCSNPS